MTHLPLPNTIGDFWRMIVERNSKVIVCLNDINHQTEDYCQVWPNESVKEIIPVDFLKITWKETLPLEHYDIISINIWIEKNECFNQPENQFNVLIIVFKKWDVNSLLPKSCDEFLSFWQEADNISRGLENIVVTCCNGATACGVYVALDFIIERMKLEQECDVCLAVRVIRRTRKEFIKNENQLKFLYEGALKSINEFQSYANFKIIE